MKTIEKINTKNNNLRKILLVLGIISILSIFLKLHTSDFTFPVNSDPLAYTLAGISHTNGDFSQSSHRGTGWSIFVSLFYHFINSENFIVFSNTIKILSLSISTITISLVYLLCRKFFNSKYSLVGAAFFAFEPHLNYNAGFGLSEPFFHLAIIGAFYFIVSKDTKFVIPSLVICSIIWWIRFNGIIFFIIILIIYFITLRKSPNFYRNLCIGICLFLIIASPMLYQKNAQFDDPFFYAYSQYVFTGSWENAISIEYENSETGFVDYIETQGIPSFLNNYVLSGLANIIETLWRISFPYFFILLPFGIIFSFRTFDQEKKYILSNWIFILISMGSLVITFSLIPEKRFLYYIFPFMIIFCLIPIQRVTEYGLNTFSFSQKQKTIFLIIVVSIALILGTMFTLRYDVLDESLEDEKIIFSDYVVKNLDGKLLREFGGSLDYLRLTYVLNSPDGFSNCKVEYNKTLCGYEKSIGHLETITISGNTIEEILSKGETYDLKYILSNEQKNVFHGFVDDIYHNEKEFPYLKKIFDSQEDDYKLLKVKIFEINYDEFKKSKINP